MRVFGFFLIPGGLLPNGLVLLEVITDSALPASLSMSVLSMNSDANWSIFSLDTQCPPVLRVSQVSISTSEFQSFRERTRLLVYLMRLAQKTMSSHLCCFMLYLQMAETNTVVFLKGKWGLEFSDFEQLLNDNHNTFHLITLQVEFVLTLA